MVTLSMFGIDLSDSRAKRTFAHNGVPPQAVNAARAVSQRDACPVGNAKIYTTVAVLDDYSSKVSYHKPTGPKNKRSCKKLILRLHAISRVYYGVSDLFKQASLISKSDPGYEAAEPHRCNGSSTKYVDCPSTQPGLPSQAVSG